MTKVHALLVDFQDDFMDIPGAALPVPGATEDAKRTAVMLHRLNKKITDITCTLDSHHNMHIAHAMMWRDNNNNPPSPFTIINKADVESGIWRARNPAWQKIQLDYVISLETNSKNQLCIWPPHCIIGTKGHSLQDDIANAVSEWEKNNFTIAKKQPKGDNYLTESYSVFRSEVPVPGDPTTNLNMSLIAALQNADILVIAGEAGSHCVPATVYDLAEQFGPIAIAKICILTDCMSPVQGYEHVQKEFFAKMQSLGATLTTSTQFLA